MADLARQLLDREAALVALARTHASRILGERAQGLDAERLVALEHRMVEAESFEQITQAEGEWLIAYLAALDRGHQVTVRELVAVLRQGGARGAEGST